MDSNLVFNTGCKDIDSYANKILSGEIRSSKQLKKAMEWIHYKLNQDNVIIDSEKAEKACDLIYKYFGYPMFDWERFIIALVHCYYADDTLVFTEYLIMMGRGNGKNGFISGLIWYLSSKAHGIRGYNTDIIANSEEQAKTSFNDVAEMINDTWKKSQKFFDKPTKILINNKNTRSYIKYNTSNAKTKDGKRSACLIFDEIHEYRTSDTLGVFKSGFGKKRHSRTFYITTNGYVRDGVLDEELSIADEVLKRKYPQSRLCPLIYKIDNEEEALDPENWVKANPSLPYLPVLRQEMEQNIISMKFDKRVELDFMTKRMNIPKNNMEIAVTEWENILATKDEDLPDFSGFNCVVGIDFSKLNDWTAVTALFRIGDKRYCLTKTWVCTQSPDLWKIKAPYEQWAKDGLVELVNEPEIAPKLMAEYIQELGRKYNIIHIGIDNFRYSLLSDCLKDVGFDKTTRNNLTLVRPSDIYKVVPVIDHCFTNKYFVWGDNPVLRWATQNTMLVRSGTKTGTDIGNYYYAKIEGKSRKTDPFMSLVHAMAVEEYLGEGIDFSTIPYIPIIRN